MDLECCGRQVIHAQKINKNAYKALIAAEYAGVKIETTPDFKMGVTNKTPEFLKLTPMGKVELLAAVSKDGIA